MQKEWSRLTCDAITRLLLYRQPLNTFLLKNNFHVWQIWSQLTSNFKTMNLVIYFLFYILFLYQHKTQFFHKFNTVLFCTGIKCVKHDIKHRYEGWCNEIEHNKNSIYWQIFQDLGQDWSRQFKCSADGRTCAWV